MITKSLLDALGPFYLILNQAISIFSRLWHTCKCIRGMVVSLRIKMAIT